jgi:hypothetical protein
MRSLAWLVVMLAGCGRLRFDAVHGDAQSVDVATSSPELYGVSFTELYRLDPVTLDVGVIGALCPNIVSFPQTSEILLEAPGTLLIATTQSRWFRLTLPSLDCVELPLTVGASLLGLAYVPPGVIDPAETVVGATDNSQFYRIDPATGVGTVIGPFTMTPSCGLAWAGNELLMTVDTGGPFDVLARVNPMDGVLTTIGPIDNDVWGLVWVDQRLRGFTAAGSVIDIDPTDASFVAVATGGPQWSGAAASR